MISDDLILFDREFLIIVNLIIIINNYPFITRYILWYVNGKTMLWNAKLNDWFHCWLVIWIDVFSNVASHPDITASRSHKDETS